MKPMQVDMLAEMEDHCSTIAMAMDVDDADAMEMFSEGLISAECKLADADFFNSFDDDFDDSDIN